MDPAASERAAIDDAAGAILEAKKIKKNLHQQ